jgi:hypothetical protein
MVELTLTETARRGDALDRPGEGRGHRLYLDPPARSLVLSVDEKSQIQAPCFKSGAGSRR